VHAIGRGWGDFSEPLETLYKLTRGEGNPTLATMGKLARDDLADIQSCTGQYSPRFETTLSIVLATGRSWLACFAEPAPLYNGAFMA